MPHGSFLFLCRTIPVTSLMHGAPSTRMLLSKEVAACVGRGGAQILSTTQNPVGAGLPAIAECQSTNVLNVTTPSRASLAPTGMRGPHGQHITCRNEACPRR